MAVSRVVVGQAVQFGAMDGTTPPVDLDKMRLSRLAKVREGLKARDLAGALFFDQLKGEDATAMAEQAHGDWSRFLELRADELVPGGRLVLDMMGRHEGGTSTGGKLWTQVRAVVDELIDEGRLDGSLVDGYVFPAYERTLDEVRRPFGEDLGERFELEHVALSDSETPAWQRYEADGDADVFARAFVGFVRAFSEPTLRAALDPDGATLDELYRRLEQRAAGDRPRSPSRCTS